MKRRLTVLMLLVAGCAGRSIVETSRDEARGGRSATATGGSSTNAPSQGATNGAGAVGTGMPGGAPIAGAPGMGRGGRAGVGTGMTTGGREGTPGGATTGAASSAGGSGGSISYGGSGDSGGSAGEAGAAGAAGATGSAGQPGDGDPTCTPTGLVGFRCENAQAYGQSWAMQEAVGATTTDECLAACAANPSCTAVSTYFTLVPPGGCVAADGNCSPLIHASWHEEDGGQLYLKGSCDSDGICNYDGVGYGRCAGTTFHPADSLDECFRYCDTNGACTNVVDHTYLDSVAGRCFMNLSTCDAPVQTYEESVLYVRCRDQ